MSTVRQIIDAAVASSVANDATTPLASNTSELVAVISRRIRLIYTLAALPNDGGRSNWFTRTTTVTVGTPNTTYVSLPTSPEPAYLPTFIDTGGRIVSVVSLEDLREDRAEYPPAIVVVDGKFRSAARTGDPAAGSVLTVEMSYLPVVMTADTDFLGATTLADATTTSWPSHVGDEYLVQDLALYLSVKDGMRDGVEVQALTAARDQAAGLLGKVLGFGQAQVTRLKQT